MNISYNGSANGKQIIMVLAELDDTEQAVTTFVAREVGTGFTSPPTWTNTVDGKTTTRRNPFFNASGQAVWMFEK